ncbi:MAG TPA: hypothetical protein VG457_16125, partial [Planctomycetota bacterium]|nr:hypothetical protein [Planctomycetota bacterium]
MTQARPLVLFLLLGAVSQDADVRDLLRRLEDDNAEVREKAQKQLGALGPAALPLLKETAESSRSSGELRLRVVAAMKEIELTAKIAKVFVEPRRITLKATDTLLREVLDEISRQAGVAIESSLLDPAAKVTLNANDAPLQMVLDQLCQGQIERT